MAQTIIVNDAQLKTYITELSTAGRRLYNSGLRFVSTMTKYAELRMKLHAPKTRRSTGKLKNSISSEVNITSRSMQGIAFVPEGIKYQFVIERGQRGGKTISGSPKLVFPIKDWKRATRSSSLAAKAHDGRFIFSAVRRGRFKGRYFTKKAYEDLLKYYNKVKGRKMYRFIQNIGFGRS